jgi:cell wall-associated NlpC family hydrolase
MTPRLALKALLFMLVSSLLTVATVTPANAADPRVERAVQYALAQQGDRYVYGANGPNAWDCSSLMQASYRHAGIRIPRTSAAQKAIGTRVSLRNLRRGDLIAYPGHIAMYVGNGKQIAATKPSTGVRVQSVYRGAQFGIRIVR